MSTSYIYSRVGRAYHWILNNLNINSVLTLSDLNQLFWLKGSTTKLHGSLVGTMLQIVSIPHWWNVNQSRANSEVFHILATCWTLYFNQNPSCKSENPAYAATYASPMEMINDWSISLLLSTYWSLSTTSWLLQSVTEAWWGQTGFHVLELWSQVFSKRR